jgi:TRAP-type C4-dicarboxylate transport system substrate-binding protein
MLEPFMQQIKYLLIVFSFLYSNQIFSAAWDMPTPYGEENHPTQIAIEFAKEVSSRTGKEIDINVHPGGKLIAHSEIFDSIKSGKVAIGEIFAGRLGNLHPIFKVDNIPFLATDYDDAEKLFTVSKKQIEKQLLANGTILLYATPWPAQSLYSNKPIRSLADIKGLNMRAYSPSTERLSELMGGTPQNVPFGEISDSFNNNTIDAMITSPSTGVSQKSWKYISHYSDIRAWIPKNITVINANLFNELSDENQEIILSAASRAQTNAWKIVRNKAREHTAIRRDNGLTISRPSLDLLEELRNIGYIMTDEWIESAGEDGSEIVDLFQQCI